MASGHTIGYKRIIVLTIVATTAGIIADKFGLIDKIASWL